MKSLILPENRINKHPFRQPERVSIVLLCTNGGILGVSGYLKQIHITPIGTTVA
ncbi:MAG: hypothetical protein IKX14_05415 [Neisseriaceae bacterium]|nr:hypothetical protein [Neisseriaceae bacterium]